MRISPVTARLRLERVPLPGPDREQLSKLLDAFGEERQLPVAQAYEILFPGRTPAAATKALERLIKRTRDAAHAEGIDLQLEVWGAKKLGPRRRTLGFTAESPEPPTIPPLHVGDHGTTILGTPPPPRCTLDDALHQIRRGERPVIMLPSGRTAHPGDDEIELRGSGCTERAAGFPAADVAELQFVFDAWLAARRPWPSNLVEDHSSTELADALDDLPVTPDADLTWPVALESAAFAFGLHSAAVEEACRDFEHEIQRHRNVGTAARLLPRTWLNIRAAGERLAAALRELGDLTPERCDCTDAQGRPCVAPLRTDGTCIRAHLHEELK